MHVDIAPAEGSLWAKGRSKVRHRFLDPEPELTF